MLKDARFPEANQRQAHTKHVPYPLNYVPKPPFFLNLLRGTPRMVLGVGVVIIVSDIEPRP